jgi:hypothetical protein
VTSKAEVSTTVGMSMAPALWLTNFALIYTLSADLGAYMPAYWTPLPEVVVEAIYTSRDGQVSYSQHRNALA